MTRNSRKQLKVQPAYGYKHPDCGMAPPAGVQPDQTLQFVLELCSWYPAKEVREGAPTDVWVHMSPACGGAMQLPHRS